MTRKRVNVVFYGLFALALLIIDQATKYWAQTVLQKKTMIDVIEGVFSFTYVRNTGAAFGMMQGQKWLLLSLVVIVLVGGILYFYKKNITHPLALLSGGAVLAGAIGNLIDRIRLSYVIDFLEVRFISFPVFNVADCCVVIGMILLGVCILWGKIE